MFWFCNMNRNRCNCVYFTVACVDISIHPVPFTFSLYSCSEGGLILMGRHSTDMYMYVRMYMYILKDNRQIDLFVIVQNSSTKMYSIL